MSEFLSYKSEFQECEVSFNVSPLFEEIVIKKGVRRGVLKSIKKKKYISQCYQQGIVVIKYETETFVEDHFQILKLWLKAEETSSIVKTEIDCAEISTRSIIFEKGLSQYFTFFWNEDVHDIFKFSKFKIAIASLSKFQSMKQWIPFESHKGLGFMRHIDNKPYCSLIPYLDLDTSNGEYVVFNKEGEEYRGGMQECLEKLVEKMQRIEGGTLLPKEEFW